MDLHRDGKIKPIIPIETYDIGNIDAAMKKFGRAKHIGKFVLSYEDPDIKLQVCCSNFGSESGKNG